MSQRFKVLSRPSQLLLRVLWSAACVGLVLSWPNLATAGKIYVYERADGSRLITDHRRRLNGLKFIKSYGSNRSSRLSGSYRYYRPLLPKISRYDSLIRDVSQQYGVDVALVKAVVQVESGFRPAVVSPKGATGLMQLMPQTAKRFGVDNREDPKQNVDGGVRYLRFLLKLFKQDTTLALAAYNAGENAVRRYKGVPPYPETVDYVRKVKDLQRIYATSS